MTRNRYKIFETDYPYHVTCTVVDWLPLLEAHCIKQIIIDSLKYLQKEKGVKIFAYVIMPNHLHMIISSGNPEKHVAQFKSFTARKIIDYYKDKKDRQVLKIMEQANPAYKTDRKYKFWQEGYCPKQITNHDIFQQKIDYIHLNPVRKGFVDSPDKWQWSSAYPNGLIKLDEIID
jgi:REP element-mobilizing transposase RayT